MTQRRPRKKMWAVLRDDEIYLIVPTRLRARHEREHYENGGYSKHAWAVLPVFVSRNVGEQR